MVSTAIGEWQIVPDIIADGVSIQEEIMTAICETKGAAFDGTDCNGELDDSTVTVCAINFLLTFLLVFSILALFFFLQFLCSCCCQVLVWSCSGSCNHALESLGFSFFALVLQFCFLCSSFPVVVLCPLFSSFSLFLTCCCCPCCCCSHRLSGRLNSLL